MSDPRIAAAFVLLLPLPLVAQDAAAELRLAPPFTDHMVLQRETNARVWGWTRPGEKVSILTSWDDHWESTSAGSDGRFDFEVVTPAAGGPYSIDVSTDGGASLTLDDVLIGEVWVCSGQSNMEWRPTQIDDAELEIARANLPRIRLFDVVNTIAMTPQSECEGEWLVCSPESVRSFSAVGFLFGRDLLEALDVPIGLIGSNWGGTVAESWTSETTLRAEFPEFHEALDRIAEAVSDPSTEDSVEARQAAWWDRFERADTGAAAGWMKDTFLPVGWTTATVPGRWADMDLAGFDGTGWYRREVELPDQFAGSDLVLELGPIDDMDLTWFNGELVGETRVMGHHTTPRKYTVPASAVRSGKNVLVVCAIDTGGVGSLGATGTPMRLTSRAAEGEVSLAGPWQFQTGASMADLGGFPTSGWFHQNQPTALSNGMLAPIIPYSIRGAIWYQGESNRTRAWQYRRLFPAMIADWRARWKQGDFPFYFVQIAPFGYGGDTGQAAELREAQFLAQAVENAGMAVTMDIGDPRDIHPTNKVDVAHRLARLALAEQYAHGDLVCKGPTYRAMTVEGGAVRLAFDHAEGLTSRGAELAHFTIAGSDRVFRPATASIDGETVVVSSPDVPAPVAVRFGWGAADITNLWNAAGLPASSFRTDDWPAVTAD